MLKIFLYLNINNFLASNKKVKCILNKYHMGSKVISLEKNYYEKSNINYSINFFRIWVLQFLSKYLICKVKCPFIYKGNFLKVIILNNFKILDIKLPYNFYSTGLLIAKLLNKKILISTLKDVFLKKFFCISSNLSFTSKLIPDFRLKKTDCGGIIDFDQMLVRYIINFLFKFKLYYIFF
nr:hypothetical protein Cry52Nrm1_p131 [Cryptomonas curvata]